MRALDGYPDSFGAKRASTFPHPGPASYTQATFNPVAGGDTVEAKEAGMKLLDIVLPAGLSDSGLYFVRAVPKAGNDSDNMQAAPGLTWVLVWYVEATGVQVAALTDLSAEVVRLFALGPK